jgi:GTP-binding protein
VTPPVIAILGRPNVGKSTLFNRLAGRRAAIVHDTPGVTRDRQEADLSRAGLSFRLVDTAGFDDAAENDLTRRMTEQSLVAMDTADICLFVIDARAGVTAADDALSRVLHRAGKPVILVANKSEGRTADLGDALRWGLGEPISVSAEHGTGMSELFDALAPLVADTTSAEETPDAAPHPLKLAIVGRPNVGKSTLFNRLLGEERALTGPETGITRDSVAAKLELHGRAILLYDTAGMRRRARAAGEALEQLSIESALNAVRFAECAILVIDATQAFERQDLAIADLIAREGRAIVFAVNKWDLVEARAGAITAMRKELDRLLPQVAGAPLTVISALGGEGISRLMESVFSAEQSWNRRLPTAELNRFLARAVERHPPPAIRGRRVRIRYMTQPKARPPTFALFGTQLKALPESWLRYLQNELRSRFDLAGSPIRFSLHTAKNPYA